MNGSRRRLSAILVGVLASAASSAHACGELMLRSLGAMRYHAFATRSPAAIVLYSGKLVDSDKRPAATDARLHDSLEKVGHRVNLARGTDQLGLVLSVGHYDVLIGYADDIVSAAGQIAKASRVPTLIPVLDSGAPNEHEMRERYPHLVTGSFSDLLTAIEQAMSSAKVG